MISQILRQDNSGMISKGLRKTSSLRNWSMSSINWRSNLINNLQKFKILLMKRMINRNKMNQMKKIPMHLKMRRMSKFFLVTNTWFGSQETSVKKILSFVNNMMEVGIVLCIALVSYIHPSVSAIWHFMAYLILFYAMTKNIKVRYQWNLIFLAILFVVGMSLIIVKMRISAIFNEQRSWDDRLEYQHQVS